MDLKILTDIALVGAGAGGALMIVAASFLLLLGVATLESRAEKQSA